MGKLYKRMLRGLKTAKGQFISIVLIIAIGSAIFAGMFVSVASLQNTLTGYYERQNLADAWLYFRGVSQDDLDELFAGEPAVTAEGRYSYDAKLMVGGAESELRIRSLSGINRVWVSEGRAPEAEWEILVDPKYAKENKLDIGDTLAVQTEDGDIPLTITGVGHSPEAVLIQKDAFAASVSNRAFGFAYATDATLVALNQVSEPYRELADRIKQEQADALVALNDAEQALTDAQAEYAAAESEANRAAAEGRQALADARRQIDDGYTEMETRQAEGQAQLAQKQAEVDAAAAQLAAAKQELDASYAEYQSKKNGLPPEEKARYDAEFAQKYAELDGKQQELDAARVMLEQQHTDAIAALGIQQAAIDEQMAALATGRAALDAAFADYEANVRPLLAEENQLTQDAAFAAQYGALQTMQDDLAEAQAQLDAAKAQADSEYNTQNEALAGLQATIDSARVELDDAYAAYLAARDGLSPEQQAIQDARFAGLYAQYEEKAGQLAAAQNALNTSQAEAEAQLEQARLQLEQAEDAYKVAVGDFNAKTSDAQAQLAAAQAEITDAEAQLADGRREYTKKSEDAADSLAAAARLYTEVLVTGDVDTAAAVAAQNENFITSFSRDGQVSYHSVDEAMAPYRTMSYLFPVIFFLVAAAITFISISKMVESQRSQIAVMQAMGVSKMNIRFGFLSYALTASVLGALLFAVLGNLFVPTYITGIFTMQYDLPGVTNQLMPTYILLPLLLSFAFTGAAAFLAVQRALRETPSQGMRPRAPKHTKTILLERWSAFWRRIGHATRLALRSVFGHKGRILLSSVGVIGSVMLLVSGFSLRDSAGCIIQTTMESMPYDLAVVLNEAPSTLQQIPGAEFTEALEFTDSTAGSLLLDEEIAMRFQFVSPGSTLVRLVGADGRAIAFDENTVVIPQTVAAEHGISSGDTIETEVRGTQATFTVTDIAEEYLAKTLYVSTQEAEAAGIEVNRDTVLMLLRDGSDVAAVQDMLRADPSVLGVTSSADIVQKAGDAVLMLNAVIVVIILAAAVLAVAVLYNISAVNILERTREYATLLVLGYSRKEVNRIISAENTALTTVGCLLGVPAGLWLFSYMVTAISRDDLTLPNGFGPLAVMLSVLFVFLFSILTSRLLRGKIRRIHLVEEIKGVE